MPTLAECIRKVELVIKRIITGNRRFSFFCDSRIRLCYFCVSFRYKLRKVESPCFAIHTKRATFVFSRRSKIKLTATLLRKSYYGFTALRQGGEDQPFEKIG